MMATLLKDLPKEELPRERMMTYGVEALSNEELLSIILRTGTRGESVRELSSKILREYKDIHKLKSASVSKLKSIKGLGNVKSITLLASLELGRRVYESDDVKMDIKISNSVDAFRYFAKYIKDEGQENFLVVYLNNQKKYITHKILFKGTINSSIVHPREVFKEALLEGATGVILMHNHPGGSLVPSRSDDETTVALIDAGIIMGVQVLDHLIVNRDDYYSYLESGRIKYEQ
jgi:DNA repair protein RadC